MSRTTIYTVDPSGTLTAMRPSEPRSEDFMQKLVAAHPELIADQDGSLLLIRREQPITDREDGSGRWSLDHLFVTRTGVPVLVELKRAVDTRLRREVIDQMLDYAANGTAYWQGGRIAESYAATMTEQGRDADAELATFLAGTLEAEDFWQQVDANFSAGRIKMVFVADTIPRELARIVEFLNEQMKADVRAVELSWFESDGGVTALTPRIIGETERAQNEKVLRGTLPPITRDAWIQEHLAKFGKATITGAEVYVSMIEEMGGRATVASTQGSIVAEFETAAGWLFPFALTRYSKGGVQLCLGYLINRSAFADDDVRQSLYDRFTSIVGPLSTKTLNGFPSFAVAQLNDPAVRDNVATFLKDVLAMAGVPG